MTSRYDVIVVGAGIIGAAFALKIATQPETSHLKIALIDSNDRSAPEAGIHPKEFDSRVVALTPKSIELLQSLGVWSMIEKQNTCSYTDMDVWDGEGVGNIQFSAKQLNTPYLGTIVENRWVLNALLDRVEACPQITVIWQSRVRHVSYQQEDVLVHLDDGSSLLNASLLVAADGGGSDARELLNLSVRKWHYQQQAIVTVATTEKPHLKTARQCFLASGPLAFLPLGDAKQRACAIVWSLDNTEAERLFNASDDEFKSELARAFEYRLGSISQISERKRFPLIQRHAVNYATRQAVLIGDAAHTIHPLAGQGANLGLLDVHVLADEVARSQWRGIPLSDASILSRYQRQRKRHNLEMMALMESFKRLFGQKNLALLWLRNVGMSQMNQSKPIKNWLAKQAMGL